jgi:hypothetical protein
MVSSNPKHTNHEVLKNVAEIPGKITKPRKFTNIPEGSSRMKFTRMYTHSNSNLSNKGLQVQNHLPSASC